jgi:hypothetical protein
MEKTKDPGPHLIKNKRTFECGSHVRVVGAYASHHEEELHGLCASEVLNYFWKAMHVGTFSRM